MGDTPNNWSEDEGEEIINLILVENKNMDQNQGRKMKKAISAKRGKKSWYERLY
tara:strand:+ start:250 stop:411 length:162 start_codon:yes stop_codon:yes gene_type:complete